MVAYNPELENSARPGFDPKFKMKSGHTHKGVRKKINMDKIQTRYAIKLHFSFYSQIRL